jgi:hypothetical protein
MRLSSIVDLLRWGGKDVQPAAAISDAATGFNPIVRNIARRYQAIVTTAPLPISGVFISPWIDTQQTGDVGIEVTCRSNVASATSGLVIQETEDPTDSNFFANITTSTSANYGTGATVSANTTTSVISKVKKRYWRVTYTNGVTVQASFSLYATASNQPIGNVTLGSALSAGYGTEIVNIGSFPSLTIGADALTTASITAAPAFYFNGASWDKARTPVIFKTVSTAALGATVIWTPTSAKKFRLMRYQIEVQEGSTLAVGGNEALTFLDNVTTIGFAHDVFVPAIALVTNGVLYQSNWIDLGNGILSAAANNALSINLGTACATGGVRVNVCGTEE